MPLDVVTYKYAFNRGRNIAINNLTSSVNTLVQLLNSLPATTAASLVDELSPTVVAKVFSNPNLQNSLAIIDGWFRSSLSNYDSMAVALANTSVSASSIASLLSQYLSSGIVSPSKIASVFASYQLPVAKIYNILTGLSGDQAQKILYAWAGSLLSIDRLIDLLTYKAASVTLGANTTYTGINIFNVLNLGGYTYSADGQPHVIIANQITGSGAITKTATGGAGGWSRNTGTGGAGGGGLIIITKVIGNSLGSISISANGNNGNIPSIINGVIEYGGSGEGGKYIVVDTDKAGTGGAGGNGGSSSAGGSGGGNDGNGGSGAINGRPGGSASYDTYSSYSSLASMLLYAAVDYFIRNVLGKTLSTVTSFPSVYGAGGGGSSTLTTNGSGGSGGGAGGQIIILAMRMSVSSIMAQGGNGSPAAQGSASYNAGGGGGGGGIIYVLYRDYYFISSYSVAGGSGGAGGTSSQNGQPGTNGTMKVVAI